MVFSQYALEHVSDNTTSKIYGTAARQGYMKPSLTPRQPPPEPGISHIIRSAMKLRKLEKLSAITPLSSPRKSSMDALNLNRRQKPSPAVSQGSFDDKKPEDLLDTPLIYYGENKPHEYAVVQGSLRANVFGFEL
ncbi:hypothetical protein FRB96_003420 [Tulasnella sp. 330]|nr:hypothetical protein FRB96_003420 [Tulasnella sp. 330]